MIYLIHFDRPYWHANHYLGFCEDSPGAFEARMERHRQGNGAKLLRAIQEAGIGWEVVRVWPNGTRDEERLLKRRKKSRLFCPTCRKEK